MDRRQRLAILSEAAALDRDARLSAPARVGNQVGIAGVRLPGGGSTTLMRIMQTNACSLSCGYCQTLSADLLPKLELAGRLLRGRPGAAGATTQFVVGPAGERDREILDVVARLEGQGLLHHAHFSAFQPVVGTPMEGLRATPAARELR